MSALRAKTPACHLNSTNCVTIETGTALPLEVQPLAGSISFPSTLNAQRPGTLTFVVSWMFTMSGVLDPGRLKKLLRFPPLNPA